MLEDERKLREKQSQTDKTRQAFPRNIVAKSEERSRGDKSNRARKKGPKGNIRAQTINKTIAKPTKATENIIVNVTKGTMAAVTGTTIGKEATTITRATLRRRRSMTTNTKTSVTRTVARARRHRKTT